MPGIPKGHKVLESGKEHGKGFYRIVQRPNGTVYKLWDRLFSPAELQSRVDAANKNEGQLSRDNIIGNTKAAMGLAAAAGGAGALTYYNFGQDRQGKVPRKIRGAAFGKTRPQGVGLKTQAASAGDVRGRVVPDRPPAIVRSAGSFNQRGPTMPQTGNLFDQPESGRGIPPGQRITTGGGRPADFNRRTIVEGLKSEPAGTFDPIKQRTAGTRSTAGQRLVKTPLSTNPTSIKLNTKPGRGPGSRVDIRKSFRASGRPAAKATGTSTPTPTQANGVAVNRNPKSPAELKAIADAMQQRRGTTMPDRAPGIAVNRSPRSAEELKAIADAKAGRAGSSTSTTQTRRTTPVQRGSAAPRTPAPSLPARNTSPATGKYSGRSTGVSTKPKTPAELKAIEDAMRARRAGTGGTSLSGQRTALRPTPLAPSRVPNSPLGPLTGDRTALRPTPINPNRPTPLNPKYTPTQARPTPLDPNAKPLVYAPKAPKPSLFGRIKGFAKASVPAAIATHMLEDAGAGVMSAAKGDWKGAGQRGLDLLSHTKFGGLIPVADQAMKGFTGKGFRDNATSVGDKIIHAKYIDGKQPAPAAKTTTPAASGGNKPAGGQKPYEPTYFPEAGRNGSAVRTPDSYLGEAFDYSLQKGTNSGTKYLEHMFRRDKISADDQQRLRERFNKKVVGDQTLKDEGASRGITQNVEGKKAGLGKELLNQYRANNAGNPLPNYQGNTDYGNMRAAAEARLAKK